MKKISYLFVFAALCLLVPSTYAAFVPTDLPVSSIEEYTGYKTYSGNGVAARLEFAVYDTTLQDMSGLDSLGGYDGETFIYAYHIFSLAGDPINSVKVFGFNPDAVTSDSLSASDELSGNVTDGIEADSWSLSGDEATWFITDQEELGAGEKSWFLLLYSNYAPIAGDFEVNPSDVGVPPAPGTEAPEPATLALLGCGAALFLKRRK